MMGSIQDLMRLIANENFKYIDINTESKKDDYTMAELVALLQEAVDPKPQTPKQLYSALMEV